MKHAHGKNKYEINESNISRFAGLSHAYQWKMLLSQGKTVIVIMNEVCAGQSHFNSGHIFQYAETGTYRLKPNGDGTFSAYRLS